MKARDTKNLIEDIIIDDEKETTINEKGMKNESSLTADDVLSYLDDHLLEGASNLPWKRGANAVIGELRKRYHGDTRKGMAILNRLKTKTKDPEKLRVMVQVAQKLHQDAVSRADRFAGRQFDKKED
jgi:hypothetical protein